MDDSIKRQMHVGVGLDISDSNEGLAGIIKQVADFNSGVNTLATTMGKAEKEIKSFIQSQNSNGTSTEKVNKATSSFVKTLKEEVASGAKTAEQAMKELQARQLELNKVLKDSSLENSLSPEEYKATVTQLAEVNKAIQNQIRNENRETATLQKKNLADVVTTSKQLNQELVASFKAVNQSYSTKGKNGLFNVALELSGVRAIANEIGNLGQELIKINYNTINNQRLMNDFSSSLRDELNASAVEIAKNSGISVTDAQEIEGAWIRINDQYAKSPTLLKEISDITAKFMNVGEIENAENAVKLMNSTLLQFDLASKNAAKNAEEIGNKFAFMADKTAMGTPDEYAEGIAKMGANVKSMNGELDDAIVLLSIVGDKLAKNGQEAGNSLNTFTAYMHREKTLKLFDDLSAQLGDADVSLREGEKGIKSYKDTLQTIADTYSALKSQGDQIGMNKIVEALGATRQRATSQAVLEAISSEDGQNLEYYYNLLGEATKQGSYLEQQNDTLMTSLKKQISVFVTSLQEAGMAFGNSGLLDGANLFMKGLSGVLEVISKLPSPIMSGITAMVALKTAITGLNKIGEITGLSEKFRQAMDGGTEASRKMASETAKTTQAFISNQQTMFSSANASDKLTSSYQAQMGTFNDYKSAIVEHNKAYADGAITASEYNKRVGESTAIYRKNMEMATTVASSEAELTTAKKMSAAASKETNLVDQTNLRTKKEKVGLLATEKVTEMSKQGYEKAGLIVQTAKNSVQTIGNTLTSLRARLTGQATVVENADTVAKTAGTVATTGLTGATTALGVALNFLLSPLVLITAAISLFSYLSGKSAKESQELQQNIDTLTSSISESKQRLEELKNQQQRSSLSGTEETELNYLQRKIELEEQSLKIKQQQKNADDYFGNHHVIGNLGGSDNNSENIKDTISDFKRAKQAIDDYNSALSGAGLSAEQLEQGLQDINKSNEDLASASADIVQQKLALEEMINNQGFSGDSLKEANELLEVLNELSPEAEAVVDKTSDLAKNVSAISAEGIQQFNDELSESRKYIEDLDSDIQNLIGGSVSASDLSVMIEKYDGFAQQVGKTTAEQVSFLTDLQNKAKQVIIDDLNAKIEELYIIKDDLEGTLQNYNNGSITLDSQSLSDTRSELSKVEEQINAIQAQKDIQINLRLNNALDFSTFVSSMDSLVESTKELTEAQFKLANGTALSNSELWNLCQKYPELLYQSSIFANGSVENERNAVNAVLDMKQQQFESSIDQKQAELRAEQETLNSKLKIENDQLNLLQEMKTAEANNELATEEQVGNFLTQYRNLELSKNADLQNQKGEQAKQSAQNEVNVADQAGGMVAGIAANVAQSHASWMESGAKAGADALANNASNGQRSLAALAEQAKQAALAVAGAFEGKVNGRSDVVGGTVGGFLGVSYGRSNVSGLNYNSTNNTIDGLSKVDWIKQQESGLNASIKQTEIRLQQINNAIANLDIFKNAGLSGVANNYYPDSGGVGSSTADKAAEQAAKDAEKAAKEAEAAAKAAAKAAEEERKAIERIKESYVKNVEELQDRIAKALKKKYEEQFNERKDLLQKEHDERVKQIQDEIDKLQGNTPEDKKNKLEDLKNKLDKWQKDDSTLGKSKQKEYMDQIKELEKEIKIDELESQLETENQKFDELIDTQNKNCDKTLQTLTQKMDEEHLYTEANDMIRNGKVQEIATLLTTYDAKWNGWATLMGQSAGDIIAYEIKVAMANYVDVLKNAITSNGGVYTNQATGNTGSSGSSSSGSSSGSSSSPAPAPAQPQWKAVVTVNSNTTMWDLAGQYYGDYYKWTKIRDANGGQDPRTLREGQKLYIPFKTGGYTGNDEGLAYLHQKEIVLNATQTSGFLDLVKILPNFVNTFGGTSSISNSKQETNINAPLTQINIDKVINKTKSDVTNAYDNLDRIMNKNLRKNGYLKKIG